MASQKPLKTDVLTDLTCNIKVDSAACLNINPDSPSVDQIFIAGDRIMQSDSDEQMIVHIPFKSHVKVKSICVRATAVDNDKSSGPREVRLYVNHPHLSFQDVDSVKPAQIIYLSQEDLEGKPIELKFVRFTKVFHIAVYMNSNQDNTPLTHFSSVSMTGFIPPITDLSKLKSTCCSGPTASCTDIS